MINATCKSRLRFSLGKVQLIKNTLKQTKFEVETVKSTHLSLVLVGLYDICSVTVSFFRVGSQISPRRAKTEEQDQSNAPLQGQQRQSNPHLMPCLPPSPSPPALH